MSRGKGLQLNLLLTIAPVIHTFFLLTSVRQGMVRTLARGSLSRIVRTWPNTEHECTGVRSPSAEERDVEHHSTHIFTSVEATVWNARSESTLRTLGNLPYRYCDLSLVQSQIRFVLLDREKQRTSKGLDLRGNRQCTVQNRAQTSTQDHPPCNSRGE